PDWLHMASSALSSRAARAGARTAGRARRRPAAVAGPPVAPPPAAAAEPWPPLELDVLAAGWQRALDAAQASLTSAAATLPSAYLSRKYRELEKERAETARLLESVARVAHVRPAPWLSPVPVTPKMLG